MTWVRKFNHVGARSFEDVLRLWSRRSPVGIEIGQNRLAEHIQYVAGRGGLPPDGERIIGPIEGRTLISELYCGVTKATNFNFHAQSLVTNRAFTNGSLHSFNSLIQFMMAIMSVFGVFVIRIGGKYFVLDVFPWLGHPKEDQKLEKQHGNDWWRYARLISDKKDVIEQSEIALLFQRCLRVISAVGWSEVVVKQLIESETRWINRPRNNILYNFTGWTESRDLVEGLDTNVNILLRNAVRTIFDSDEQVAYGPLPQSLLLGSLFLRVWSGFRGSVVMELNGEPAPAFPAIVDPGLIGAFEAALIDELASAV